MSYCAHLNPGNRPPGAVDSYCRTYEQIIREKGDGTIVASRGVKNRIAANELTYQCVCRGVRSPLCEQKK